jgi:hypothetical protein
VGGDQVSDDFEKHLVVLALVLTMWIQESSWFVLKDDVHLLLMVLEAAAAGALLRLLLRGLDPNLPALPLHYFATVSIYNAASAFLILQYAKHVFELGYPPMYIALGALLAVLLFAVPYLSTRRQSRILA